MSASASTSTPPPPPPPPPPPDSPQSLLKAHKTDGRSGFLKNITVAPPKFTAHEFPAKGFTSRVSLTYEALEWIRPRDRNYHDTMREIFLWRRKKLSFSVLAISTVMWVLLEIFQYTFVTVASWVAILTVTSLFVWAHLAPLLGRDVPSCSGLEVSEQSAVEIADAVRSWAEDAVRWLFHAAVERNWLVVAQIITALVILSFVGSCFDFLTLLYIGVLMGLTLPVLYFKYQDRIQACVERVKMCGRKSSERVKMDGRKLSERVKMDGRKLSEMFGEKILRKNKKKVSKEKKTE